MSPRMGQDGDNFLLDPRLIFLRPPGDDDEDGNDDNEFDMLLVADEEEDEDELDDSDDNDYYVHSENEYDEDVQPVVIDQQMINAVDQNIERDDSSSGDENGNSRREPNRESVVSADNILENDSSEQSNDGETESSIAPVRESRSMFQYVNEMRELNQQSTSVATTIRHDWSTLLPGPSEPSDSPPMSVLVQQFLHLYHARKSNDEPERFVAMLDPETMTTEDYSNILSHLQDKSDWSLLIALIMDAKFDKFKKPFILPREPK